MMMNAIMANGEIEKHQEMENEIKINIETEMNKEGIGDNEEMKYKLEDKEKKDNQLAIIKNLMIINLREEISKLTWKIETLQATISTLTNWNNNQEDKMEILKSKLTRFEEVEMIKAQRDIEILKEQQLKMTEKMIEQYERIEEGKRMIQWQRMVMEDQNELIEKIVKENKILKRGIFEKSKDGSGKEIKDESGKEKIKGKEIENVNLEFGKNRNNTEKNSIATILHSAFYRGI